MGATLNSLDDAILPSANWVLQLQDAREELKAATGIEVTQLDICPFQEKVCKPFIRLIKDNISSRFRSASKDVLSAFSIFDPKKVPASLLMSYLYMETVYFKLSVTDRVLLFNVQLFNLATNPVQHYLSYILLVANWLGSPEFR